MRYCTLVDLCHSLGIQSPGNPHRSWWACDQPDDVCCGMSRLQDFFVHDESAHPKGGEEHVGLAHGMMMQWVRKIEGNLRSGAGAFLPLEQSAAKV